MKYLWIVIACALSLVRTAEAQSKSTYYAIVIGNNAPPTNVEELGTLRYADDDAARYNQLFSRLGTSTLLTVLDSKTQPRSHPHRNKSCRAGCSIQPATRGDQSYRGSKRCKQRIG